MSAACEDFGISGCGFCERCATAFAFAYCYEMKEQRKQRNSSSAAAGAEAANEDAGGLFSQPSLTQGGFVQQENHCRECVSNDPLICACEIS